MSQGTCAESIEGQGKAIEDVQRHLAKHDATLSLLEPFGAEIRGLHVGELIRAGVLRHASPFAIALELAMAYVGLLVFRDQGIMNPAEQIAASELFGAGQLHSTHGEHAKAGSPEIFRLSSSAAEGIVGPGAEWHNDGSFATDVFSHAGYHIVRLPSGQASGTSFAHLGLAHDLLHEDERRLLRRMASVNSNGGAVHPLIHSHPRSMRPCLFLHLAMTGAIVHVGSADGAADGTADGAAGGAAGGVASGAAGSAPWTGLDEEEVASLLGRVGELFDDRRVAYHHSYRAGDLVVIDNWAVAHKAFPHSFDQSRGVRVVHRTTVKSREKLRTPPEWRLPETFPQSGHAPARLAPSAAGGRIAWVEGYVGLRWRACEAADLAGDRSAELVMMQTPCYADGAAHGFDDMPPWLSARRRPQLRRARVNESSASSALWMRFASA